MFKDGVKEMHLSCKQTKQSIFISLEEIKQPIR